jgi:hypothetical protein
LVGGHPRLQQAAHFARAPGIAALQLQDQSHHGGRRRLRRRVRAMRAVRQARGPSAFVRRQPRERGYLDGGRRTTQLMRDSLGGV